MARTKSGSHKIAKLSEADQAVVARRRFVCVHGHFYQPPRETPGSKPSKSRTLLPLTTTGTTASPPSVTPPTAPPRIVDLDNQIIRIVNNYARMSFNFGPTLLSWLHDNAPRTYRMILDADKASQHRYSGHGSAMAQVYNHIIMPLASRRDALTQIRWGIADFEHRFGRKPEGMWLAETAANRSVLDLMAQEGILFTILAPSQCARVRKLGPDPGSDNWIETPNATVDPGHPYFIQLDEGPLHRRLLLRWPTLPCHRLRGPPQQRRRVRPPPP